MAFAPPTATDDDVREFRRIRSAQGGVRLDGETSALIRSFVRLNRSLGRPWQLRWSIDRAVRSAWRGVAHNGPAVSAEHGVGMGKQFLQILSASARTGMSDEEYYLYESYRPERWPLRFRQFPTATQALPAEDWLIRVSQPLDFPHLRNKHLFAARCVEAGLPSIRVIAEFVDGTSRRHAEVPRRDLFSKPVDQQCGIGAEVWEYDRARDGFISAASGTTLGAEGLLSYLAERSGLQPMVLQERLENHSDLAPLTNGALATLRLVTCVSPSGSVDLMPPVLRMPTGNAIVDSFNERGLSAPVDFATGRICGAAAQKDDALGVRWFEKHPDTGRELIGFEVPKWKEASALVRRAHASFQSIKFIGWDVAIAPDGPVLVEGNALFGTDVTVVPHKITLSDTQFIPYYNYHWQQAMRAEAAHREPRSSLSTLRKACAQEPPL